MRRITLHTSSFTQEIENLAQALQKRNICNVKNGTTFYWESSANAIICEELLHLLQHITMMANPVYRHSPTLRDLAEGLRNTDVHIYELERLKIFVRQNNELNLEGYLTFRMEAYCAKLDAMLYTIVKKIRTCGQ